MRDNSPILFLHLFKCGGTSIIDRMARIVGKDRLYHAKGTDKLHNDLASSAPAIRNARVIAGHIRLDVIDTHFPDAPILTVLRDPFDRMVSQYFHFRREGLQQLSKNKSGKKESHSKPVKKGHRYRCEFCAENDFAAFVTDDNAYITAYTHNYMTRCLAGLRACDTETHRNDMLEIALKNLNRFALVLATDQIDAAFDAEFKKLANAHFGNAVGRGFSWATNRKKNVSLNRDDKTIEIAPSTLDVLIEQNQADIALYAARRWFKSLT